MSLAAAEKRHVETVLRESEWNITRAARILDVDRTTIYNKIKQYGLTKS
jgi:transcriptional regulator of acetoin/glycerol metabolism